MSHHLDSPIARQDPRLDITDLYVFRGEHGTVLISDHSHSLAGEDVPRGLHPEGRYEFKIDSNGDAIEDLTFRFTFVERDEDGQQAYELRLVQGEQATDPLSQGRLLTLGTTGQVQELSGGGRVWVGKAGDPFWIEPDVLHAVGHAFEDGARIDLVSWDAAGAVNLFAGHSVYSIVLELPDEELLALTSASRSIRVWALASLATDAGGWRPINRAALPMVHPLFTQFDEDLGDRLNQNPPSQDVELYTDEMTAKVAGVVRANGTAQDPEAYARSAVHRLLPNTLPYTIGTPACLGFADWNGRSLTDNAPDVMFSIASNSPVSLGIGKESVAFEPSTTFPYVSPLD